MLSKPKFVATLCAAFLAAILGLGVAYSMAITPIVLDLEEVGPKSSGSIAVTNPNEKPMPVTLEINRIELDKDGNIISTTPATDDFLTLPPQAIIPAGQLQNFRIQYVGGEALTASKLYQYRVDQVPVSLEKEDPSSPARIQLIYSVTGLITLAPTNGSSEVSVVGGGIAIKDGEPHPTVTLRNSGNRHIYLSRGTLTVRQRDASGKTIWRESFSSLRIEKELGFGILMPGQDRTYVLPYKLPSSEGIVEVEFDKGRQD